MAILWIYLIVINLVAFGTMGQDKLLAKQHRRRVPEARLFFYAAIGGALGSWCGMRAYRHKTKHTSFRVGIPALLALNVICVWLIARALA